MPKILDPSAIVSPSASRSVQQIGPFSLLALASWCGITSGLLEVGTIIVRKQWLDPNHLYQMSRAFVWLIPLTNLFVFMALGVVLCILLRFGSQRGWWITARFLCAVTILPALLVAFPQIHGLACLIVAVGFSARLVPVLERHEVGLGRLVRFSLPVVASLVMVLAAWQWWNDRLSEWRENGRSMPAPGSPNILLIVMDTVAAEHLSLHGYQRPTSTTLDEVAAKGVRFDSVRSTCSWTLPSHASFFTGRWPHELSTGWLNPLDATYTTIAEFLGSKGYATAGFVGNTMYCASDSGLARGFSIYHDYIFPRLTAFKVAVLIDRVVDGIRALDWFLENWLEIEHFKPLAKQFWLYFNGNRKEAGTLNREFLDWLTRRKQPTRPFFAFLNYFDAHAPYELPPGRIHRFGKRPDRDRDVDLIRDWWPMDKRGISERDLAYARDAYDDCVAYLDEQLGRLLDELERRAVLDQTWVIITSDHGESFGEHPGVFCHGTSLYQTELHVPLLFIPPSGTPSKRVITETVSLRDLAATLADIAGFRERSPFPGESLARFWKPASSGTSKELAPTTWALSEVVPIDPRNLEPNQMLKPRWPLAALAEGGWSYIRRGDQREELYSLREDAMESLNLLDQVSQQAKLERLRGVLNELTGGVLTFERFNP